MNWFNSRIRFNQNNSRYFYLCVGTLLVGAAGPFGTYESMSFIHRLAYWFIVIVSSIVASKFVRRAAYAMQVSRLFQDVVIVALMAMVYSPALFLMSKAMAPQDDPMFPSYWRLTLFVVLVSSVVAVVRRYADAKRLQRAEDSVPMPRLMRRLPGSFNGHIIRMNVNDHLVNVVTSAGEYSIRVRFGDAIEEMDPIDGFCTHRSHWVAKQAVSGWEKDKGKTYLRLVNGDRVPVSRTYRTELEEAGIL